MHLQVRDMHVAKRDADIGFYAGYIGELMFIRYTRLRWMRLFSLQSLLVGYETRSQLV
jgi:hypothetical protein